MGEHRSNEGADRLRFPPRTHDPERLRKRMRRLDAGLIEKCPSGCQMVAQFRLAHIVGPAFRLKARMQLSDVMEECDCREPGDVNWLQHSAGNALHPRANNRLGKKLFESNTAATSMQ